MKVARANVPNFIDARRRIHSELTIRDISEFRFTFLGEIERRGWTIWQWSLSNDYEDVIYANDPRSLLLRNSLAFEKYFTLVYFISHSRLFSEAWDLYL